MVSQKLRPYPRYQRLRIDWLKELPAEWEAQRFKFCVQLINDKGADTEQSFYVALENIESSTGKLLAREAASDPESVVSRFAVNDVLFGKLRPYLAKSWKADRTGVCSTEFFVLRGRRYVPEYLRWVCLSQGFVAKVDGSTFGSKMPRASWGDVGEIASPLPSLDEQRLIAAFLDREVARVDILIERKSRQIELLREKRAAVISRVVTRGLDAKIPLRDSGIPWLGQVPEHWRVVPLTKYLESIVDYRGATPAKIDDGVFLVTTRNIRDGQIDYLISQEYIDPEDYEATMRRGKPRIGDVLFTMEAPLGQTANVDREDVALAQRIVKFRPRAGALDPYFLKYWIMCAFFQQDLSSYSTGSTAQGIKASKLGYLRVVLPPIDEQRAIVEFLETDRRKDEEVLTKIAGVIDLLAEYRSAMITSAVTGEVDVREAA